MQRWGLLVYRVVLSVRISISGIHVCPLHSRSISVSPAAGIEPELRLQIREYWCRSLCAFWAWVAIGVQMDGIRNVLGMWVGENESAKFCGIDPAKTKPRNALFLLSSAKSISCEKSRYRE